MINSNVQGWGKDRRLAGRSGDGRMKVKFDRCAYFYVVHGCSTKHSPRCPCLLAFALHSQINLQPRFHAYASSIELTSQPRAMLIYSWAKDLYTLSLPCKDLYTLPSFKRFICPVAEEGSGSEWSDLTLPYAIEELVRTLLDMN